MKNIKRCSDDALNIENLPLHVEVLEACFWFTNGQPFTLLSMTLILRVFRAYQSPQDNDTNTVLQNMKNGQQSFPSLPQDDYHTEENEKWEAGNQCHLQSLMQYISAISTVQNIWDHSLTMLLGNIASGDTKIQLQEQNCYFVHK